MGHTGMCASGHGQVYVITYQDGQYCTDCRNPDDHIKTLERRVRDLETTKAVVVDALDKRGEHIAELEGLVGERYSHPKFPGVIFPRKDDARAVQNLWDNCDAAEKRVAEFRRVFEDWLCPACKSWPGEADGSCPRCVDALNVMESAGPFGSKQADGGV